MKIELDKTVKEKVLWIIQRYQPVLQYDISVPLEINTRMVRRYVRQLKEEGNLIKGTDKGYIMAKDPKEFDEQEIKLKRSLKLLRDMKRRYEAKKNKSLFEK